jgi:prepilin-type N-terminal cleavage/methylation domain-containing protein/prepilin-type processing-associated H-X9-DG protein
MNIPSPSHPPRSANRAFTLIELLTVIAIIGILAAILIPTVGAVRAKANNTKCTANARQISNAIQMYVIDNKGFLPGPMNGNQPPSYSKNDDGAIGNRLASYLSIPAVSAQTVDLAVLVCPTNFSNGIPTTAPYWFFPDVFQGRNGTTKVIPFGNKTNNFPPVQLSKIENPSTAAMFKENKQGNPLEFVHTTKGRTTLFFDGHVGLSSP